ncbi:hypothetical protein ACOME3_003951 [Neoechinorhynchus agilis]
MIAQRIRCPVSAFSSKSTHLANGGGDGTGDGDECCGGGCCKRTVACNKKKSDADLYAFADYESILNKYRLEQPSRNI